MITPQFHPPSDDRVRPWAYVLVAAVALWVGYLLGLLGGGNAQASRADWPPAESNPRALSR